MLKNYQRWDEMWPEHVDVPSNLMDGEELIDSQN